MRITTWPISRTDKDDVCRIGIPQRLGDGKCYSEDTYHSFPSLEEAVGEDWVSLVLSMLVEREGLLAWWIRTGVFKKSGLRRYRAISLPDKIKISTPLTNLLIRRFPLREVMLLVVDVSDNKVRDQIINWSGGDTEIQPEFICSAPTNIDRWETAVIAEWCRSKERWSDPTSVLPSHAQQIIGLFDGDIYCALRQADAEKIMSRIHGLARSWGISIITGPDQYSWLPGQQN